MKSYVAKLNPIHIYADNRGEAFKMLTDMLEEDAENGDLVNDHFDLECIKEEIGMNKYVPVYKVTAVGTHKGESVIFLHDDKMNEVIIPTTLVVMAKLAAQGIRIRNVN